MHDKAVRRRRAVLVVLVAASLILLTAYYGESSDGRLHSVQRGALGALSPIQEGASRVLKPFATCSAGSGTRSTPRTSATRRSPSATSCARSWPTANERVRRGRAAGARSTSIDDAGGMSKYGPVDARVYRALAEHLVPARSRSTRAPTTASTAATR